MNEKVISNSKNNNHKKRKKPSKISGEIVLAACQGVPNVSDSVKLLSLFPLEIWTMIIKYVLATATEMANLSLASLFFRDFYLPHRVQYLFPQVLSILKHQHVGGRRARYHSGRYQTNITLKCRLVCRDWNSAVEESYQHNSSHFPIPATTTNCELSRVLLTNDDEIRDFCDHFQGTHVRNRSAIKNPFMGRSLCLEIPNGSQTASNLDAVYDSLVLLNISIELRDLLAMYGHYIWHYHMQLPRSYNGIAYSNYGYHYRRLTGFTKFTKNLKTLSVCISGNCQPKSKECNELKREISEEPFQTLEMLENLRTENVPVPIFDELIRVNQHITKLQMTTFQRKYIIFMKQNQLPHLKALCVTASDAKEFLYFGKSNIANWNLEEAYLKLEYPEIETEKFIEWSRIFRVVQKWGNTLKCLELHLPPEVDFESESKLLAPGLKLRLKLPHLQKLTLSIPYETCIDFLLPMKNTLQELHIIRRGMMKGQSGIELRKQIKTSQTIQFGGYAWRMHTSNIWNIFSELQKITVTRPDGYFYVAQ